MLVLIADLHLEENQPQITANFLSFLQHLPPETRQLYLLGDIFNVWVGDDAMTPYHHQIAQALRQVSQRSIEVFIMHGNRDFALGATFCQLANCTLLPDPYVFSPFGQKLVLSHGDILCTADKGYQRLRKVFRNPLVQRLLYLTPVSWRQKLGNKTRSASAKNTKNKPSYITDVTQSAVVQLLEKSASQLLIHGHTHKPQVHEFTLHLEGKSVPAQRYVLGDWQATSAWQLLINADSLQLKKINKFNSITSFNDIN